MAFFGAGGLGREYMIAIGAMRRRFRRIGVLAYSVVARRIALTLRRKSTAKERGVYGLKNDCRDCRADQRMTAACQSSAIFQTIGIQAIRELQP